MFTKKTDPTIDKLNDTVINLLAAMEEIDGDSDEYARMTDQLEKLYKMKDISRPDSVKNDTLALIAGNLAGILLIVGHERANVVTSKALSFVTKLK